MVKKLIVMAVLGIIAFMAYAVIKTNLDSRRANLNEKAAPLILEGMYIAQNAYYKKHGKYAIKISQLDFPKSINDKLRELGNEYVINNNALLKMENGGYIQSFKFAHWTSEEQQKFFILMVPGDINRGFVCWLYLDFAGKEGHLALDGGLLQIDIPEVLSNPQEFDRALSKQARTYKTLHFD